MEQYKLESYRFTPARGWYWKVERLCNLSTGEEWLNLFQKDEIGIKFRLVKVKSK